MSQPATATATARLAASTAPTSSSWSAVRFVASFDGGVESIWRLSVLPTDLSDRRREPIRVVRGLTVEQACLIAQPFEGQRTDRFGAGKHGAHGHRGRRPASFCRHCRQDRVLAAALNWAAHTKGAWNVASRPSRAGRESSCQHRRPAPRLSKALRSARDGVQPRSPLTACAATVFRLVRRWRRARPSYSARFTARCSASTGG